MMSPFRPEAINELLHSLDMPDDVVEEDPRGIAW